MGVMNIIHAIGWTVVWFMGLGASPFIGTLLFGFIFKFRDEGLAVGFGILCFFLYIFLTAIALIFL